tara:strand:- start:257 stop:1246 length:990 start_codon:yes stop_codon:yes gene_type:complete
MESFFTRLSHFRQRPNRKPEEDFFTEVFAGVLSREKELVKYLFEKLTKLDLDSDLKIETQAVYNDGRPDIKIYGKNVLILIENKIESEEREDQLLDYSRILEKEKKSNSALRTALIYITKYYVSNKFILDKYKLKDTDFEKHFKKACKWNDIYEHIKKYNESNKSKGVNSMYIEDFLQFTEDKKLIIEKVEREIVKGTEALVNLFSQIEEVLNKIKEKYNIEKYERSASVPYLYSLWTVKLDKKKGDFLIFVFYSPLEIICGFKSADEKFKKEPIIKGWKDHLRIDPYVSESTNFIKNTNFLDSKVNEQLEKLETFISKSINTYNEKNV